MDAYKRLISIMDAETPMALAYPLSEEGIEITPLHFFQSDIAKDPGWYVFASAKDKAKSDVLNKKILALKSELINKGKDGTLTNEEVDKLKSLIRERDAIKTIKCQTT